jgi:amidase
MGELRTKGTGELAAMIRAHQVASREVVDDHLARIEEVNPSVNEVIVALADAAATPPARRAAHKEPN